MSARKNPLQKVVAESDFTRAPHRVRIIGGKWKRSHLPVPALAGLRPTPDRVRETLFNWIEHLVPDLDAVRGLDLFAGTGALGFELASRGARQVRLVESNRQLIDQLTQVKRKLAADQVDIVAADALSVAARWPAASFEIIFVDPPFDSALLIPALAASARLVTADGLIYVESGAPIEANLTENRFQVERSGRAGRVFFCLLRPASA
ncbi:MAG: RsmD family RNA methyltransferase [Burkholderiaceae bacterium]